MGFNLFKRIDNPNGEIGYLGEVSIPLDQETNLTVSFAQPVSAEYLWLLFGGAVGGQVGFIVKAQVKIFKPDASNFQLKLREIFNEYLDSSFLAQQDMVLRIAPNRESFIESLDIGLSPTAPGANDWFGIKFYGRNFSL